ncbi:hypothetical protein J6590_004167 [Homalodisca vitripennis]|nr:hypothetical protein J6590_004167 [Homalodisca vitripennis]
MIANTSGNKLKASKGFRESDGFRLLVSEEKTKVDRGEGDKDRYSGDIQGKSSYSTSVVYSRDRALKPRTKHRDDFRFSRGTSERRGGGSRGRGTTHRKMDKDGEIFIPRGKFQESLMKGKSSDGVSLCPSKYNNDTDGGKSKSGK